MTNDKRQIADAIRDAGYGRSRRLGAETEQLLSTLPRRKKKTTQDKVLMATAIAAALMVFCAFGLPKVVEAAEALYRRLMGQQVEALQAYQALPKDEKLQKTVANVERFYLGHDVNVSTEFQGVTITLEAVSFSPDNAYDPSVTKGAMAATLTFSQIPPFDPHWIDFTLSYGGKAYSMELDDSVKTIREQNVHATTEAEWLNDNYAFIANTRIIDGVPGYSLFVPVDDWRIEQVAEMTLSGTIDGQMFEIPFTYDPDLAHAEAVKDAERSMTAAEDYNQEQLDIFAEGASRATLVGYEGESYGVKYAVTEVARAERWLYTTLSVPGVKETNPKIAGMTYFVGMVYLDGHPLAGGDWNDCQIEAGDYAEFSRWALPEDYELPQTSLIAMRLELGNKDGRDEHSFDESGFENVAYSVFRYDWEAGTATLPRDAAQDAAWLQEAKAMRDAVQAQWPKPVTYALSGAERQVRGLLAAQPLKAVMELRHKDDLRLLELKLDEHAEMLIITCDFGFADAERPESSLAIPGEGTLASPSLRIGGLEARYAGRESSPSGQCVLGFVLPEGASIGPGTALSLKLPAQVVQTKKMERTVLEAQLFEFEMVFQPE